MNLWFSLPDIDECKVADPCNISISNCSNTHGSYACKCFAGYFPLTSSECIGKSKRILIIILCIANLLCVFMANTFLEVRIGLIILLTRGSYNIRYTCNYGDPYILYTENQLEYIHTSIFPTVAKASNSLV